MPARIEIVDARQSSADRRWITNVYPFYLHDLSEFDDEFYRLDAHGQWQPDLLPFWFSEPTQYPLLTVVDGQRAGFAFVGKAPFPHMTPGMDYKMCEFFVLRKLRRTGIGGLAAGAIFDRFPGTWEVTELPRNTAAVRFWRRIIGAYTAGNYEDSLHDGSMRQVFSSMRVR